MKKTTIAIVLVISVFVSLTAFVRVSTDTFEIVKNLEIFSNLYRELNKTYVDQVDPGELMHVGISAMLKSLDPYTRYISEADIENHRIHSEGKYQGFGGRLKKIGEYNVIVDILEDGPAANAGLIAGDKIVSIEGVDVKGKSTSDIQDILSGLPASQISISVIRYGETDTRTLALDRKQVNLKNVPYYGMVDNDIAYIALTTFTADAGKNVRGALSELKKNNPNLKGVIVDLRNNGGGLLSEAIRLCNIFLPNNTPIVSTRNKVPSLSKSYKTLESPLDKDIPLAVLINENSASASEIVSGVIQDYDRGILVGRRSFGKGLVQVYKPLKYNTQLKLTISKYFIPSGRCIQSVSYDSEGNPVHIAEEDRNIFKTANARPVRDGGGVAPDIVIDDELKAPYIKHLQDEEVFMFYATKYYLQHQKDSITPNFSFTDFEDFKKFVQKYDFAKPFGPTQELTRLQSSLSANFGAEDFSEDFAPLTQKIETLSQSLLDEQKAAIEKIITREIISRYHYTNGVIENSLHTDKDVLKAVEVLKDVKEYEKILHP